MQGLKHIALTALKAVRTNAKGVMAKCITKILRRRIAQSLQSARVVPNTFALGVSIKQKKKRGVKHRRIAVGNNKGVE